MIDPLKRVPLPDPAPAGKGATVPDQDLLLGLRLSRAGELGLPWELYLPQALLGWCRGGDPVCVCSVTQQRDNYSIHMPACTSSASSHTPTHLFSPPCRPAPTLTSPLTAGERPPVLLGKVPALVEDGQGSCRLSKPWATGKGRHRLQQCLLIPPLSSLRRHPLHLWSPIVLSISGWKPPEVKGM